MDTDMDMEMDIEMEMEMEWSTVENSVRDCILELESSSFIGIFISFDHDVNWSGEFRSHEI